MGKTARVASTLLVAGAATVAMTGIANAAPVAPSVPVPGPNDVLNTVIAGAATTVGSGVDMWTVGVGKLSSVLGFVP